MFKFKNRFLFMIFLTLFTTLAFANSPVTQLKNISDRMLAQLEQNKSRLSNLSVIRHIVNTVLLPNIDLGRMSASVVGLPWRSASDAQKAQFKKEFAYLVTTTYASALSSYDDDRVEFYPIRENLAGRQTAHVNSVIMRKNGQQIPISYDVVNNGGNWKVYDFSIEHVSMVQSYRAQFASTLANGGMQALLQRLRSHNQKTG
ncbi:MAG TPA: ABC transporter substrate-binding protein [Coxiellaceae bacterium]|nr:ABC transporter substrate-binding protein [Coxiellaceae bacterium]